MKTLAVRAADCTNSIGINTHIDFSVTAYSNFSVVEAALTYLGVKQIRDATQFPLFAQVAAANGIKLPHAHRLAAARTGQHRAEHVQERPGVIAKAPA
jgi:hypothetical protein